MAELTRLRRHIRGSSGDWFGDAEQLLDAADQVLESFETTERDLAQDSVLDEDQIAENVRGRSSALIRTIVHLGGLHLKWILSIFVEELGFEYVANTLASLGPEHDAPPDDSLGDLDKHLF